MSLLLIRPIYLSELNVHENNISYYFLILLAMLISNSAYSQVTADFTTFNSTRRCA